MSKIKMLTIRMPEDMHHAIKMAALKRRTSVQALVAESVNKNLQERECEKAGTD